VTCQQIEAGKARCTYCPNHVIYTFGYLASTVTKYLQRFRAVSQWDVCGKDPEGEIDIYMDYQLQIGDLVDFSFREKQKT